jgi:hypothetical protein
MTAELDWRIKSYRDKNRVLTMNHEQIERRWSCLLRHVMPFAFVSAHPHDTRSCGNQVPRKPVRGQQKKESDLVREQFRERIRIVGLALHKLCFRNGPSRDLGEDEKKVSGPLPRLRRA